MDDATMFGSVPEVPAALKYVELRLPGTFRELLANRNFSNEEIGRIIRCIALDTDVFMTQKIEPEVFYYRQRLMDKDRIRKRVAECRNRKRVDLSGGKLSSQVGVTVTRSTPVTVTGGQNSEGSLSHPEKTPTNPEEKTPPIVPLEKKAPSSLEKSLPVARKKTKRERVADNLAMDLFEMAAGRPPDGSAATGPDSRQETPQEPSAAPGGVIVGQDIESDSRAVYAHPAKPAKADTRDDAAWIPRHFERFWASYPRKVAKGAACKAFTRVIKAQSDVEGFMSTIMASLTWWKSQDAWTKDDGKYIPYPATWINRGSWADSMDNESHREAEFLVSDEESEADLIRRMNGG